MDIGERDLIIQKLNEQLNVLSNYKLERARELQEKVSDNVFLERVANDYKKQNQQMIELKNRQAQQIEYLLLYLEKSIAEVGINESMLEYANQQKIDLQNKILEIKDELDEIY